jgi:hypothetical protein
MTTTRRMALRGLAALAVPVCFAVGLAAPASGASPSWTEYTYHANGNSLGSTPATVSGSTVSFNFSPTTYVALLTTTDKSLTGNLSGSTLNDAVNVTGMTTGATFDDQNGGTCSNPPSVRFYFASQSAGGNGGGFYSRFWWSNPVSDSVPLTNDGSGSISVPLNDPSQWSNWDGKVGNSSPDVMAAFESATSRVSEVGVSFGGGCFFENGVTVSNGTATFNSQFSES